MTLTEIISTATINQRISIAGLTKTSRPVIVIFDFDGYYNEYSYTVEDANEKPYFPLAGHNLIRTWKTLQGAKTFFLKTHAKEL